MNSKSEDVLQGLKCCTAKSPSCQYCPYNAYLYHCRKHLMKDALTVINKLYNA